ncbi:MAG: hypothetical protein U0929_11625 [Planctomycetaceae bacterium]
MANSAHGKYPGPDSLLDKRRHTWCLPKSEYECAAFRLRAIELATASDDNIQIFKDIYVKTARDNQDRYEAFLNEIVVPLCSYLNERVRDGEFLLYMLTRYQRESAWFNGDQLASILDSADSRKIEEVFDHHLRAWLFREGIDFPFSAPNSPSGRADVIVWQGEQPLPVEIKVCDDANRDARHVEQGLWQAHRYALDYSKAIGYLVVFNTSDRPLVFEGNVSGDGPPCVVVNSVSVFVIVVNVTLGRASASKERPVAPRIIRVPGAPTESA